MNNQTSITSKSGQDCAGKAFIIHPVLNNKNAQGRDIDQILDEIEGLARAINLDIIRTHTIKVAKVRASSFLGKGTCRNIAAMVEEAQVDIVIVNETLSPVQQRNLENALHAKVIDRTGLILEIFGDRAQTKEGRIQVELAALQYQRSRLVRSWTHLERQRGGAGFMGGPGERQIEIDRRLIGGRLKKLKKELESVRRTRDLGRKGRERVPYPVIALVGYTNAGKSTLFNRLTKAKVMAEDLLFATLDPIMRKITLKNGQDAIIADTVGFISDLPTHLIESFRSTLDQVSYSDVILHVIDCSRVDFEAQRSDVITVLKDLDINYEEDERIFEIYNKIDLLDEEIRADFIRKANFDDKIICLSAVNGEGESDLLDRITEIVGKNRVFATFMLGISDGKALSWLYDHAEVLKRSDSEEGVRVNIDIAPKDLDIFTKTYGYKAL